MPRIFFISFVLALTFNFTVSDQNGARLTVDASGRSLEDQNGKPFFWLGDTGWQLFTRLTYKEALRYLDNRKSKGFNVIQACILPEADMERENRNGQQPLTNNDPSKPNEHYFLFVDSIVSAANARHIYLALMATWGDKVIKGPGPVLFDTANAYWYAHWLAARYKHYNNIIWLLGGDVPVVRSGDNYLPIWRAMARGIISATGGQCLISYHPNGERSSSEWLHQEQWLNFNMIQSSHGRHDAPTWEYVTHDLALSPAKPTVDAEPNYEDHPVAPWPRWNVDSGYFRDYDVRKQLYRSVFSGAMGVTYGHHAVWQFLNERELVVNYADRGWVNALDRPGAFQAGYLRKLIESRNPAGRVPDLSIVAASQGTAPFSHIESFHGADNSYAMAYVPERKKISVDLTFMSASSIVAWNFDPVRGTASKIGVFPRKDQMEFSPETKGASSDWVLVIDDAEKKYPAPGR